MHQPMPDLAVMTPATDSILKLSQPYVQEVSPAAIEEVEEAGFLKEM